MSEVSQVSETQATDGTPQPHEPHIRIVKGNPTDDDVAALVAVLGAASGGSADQGQPENSRWGLPVDRLRYAITNYQRITLQERIHMRR